MGQKVAYNLSGAVATGKIVGLTEGTPRANGWGWEKKPMIKVKADDRFSRYAADDGISKVRDPHNLLVIVDTDSVAELLYPFVVEWRIHHGIKSDNLDRVLLAYDYLTKEP